MQGFRAGGNTPSCGKCTGFVAWTFSLVDFGDLGLFGRRVSRVLVDFSTRFVEFFIKNGITNDHTWGGVQYYVHTTVK